MSAINLTTKQIQKAADRMSNLFENSVDANRTSMVAKYEVAAYDGKGQAAVRKFFAAASRKEGFGEAVDLVSLSTVQNRIDTAVKTLKKVAATKGNKDGRVQGTAAEMGSIKSESAKALARYAHAIKS